MRLHCLKHASFEGPCLIEDWIEKNSLPKLTFTHCYEADRFPAPGAFDGLIIMGGPMGVYETEKYPWLLPELNFIREAISQKKKILGICFGAQLIASALGAKVFPHSKKEIGWFEVSLTEKGKTDPLLKVFPPHLKVLHWHGDTFSLPDGALHLMESKGCKNQAFSKGENIIGLQFHLEVSPESVEAFTTHLSSDVRPSTLSSQSAKYQFVQSREEILSQRSQTQELVPLLSHLLDGFFLK